MARSRVIVIRICRRRITHDFLANRVIRVALLEWRFGYIVSPLLEVEGRIPAEMDGPAIGAISGCRILAVLEVLAGATALPRPWQAWAIGSSIGISAVLIVALALPHEQRQWGTFRGDTYAMAVAFEAVAIFATIWLLKRFALSQFLLPAIGFIVGLHFLGLWKATYLRVFLWTALAMCIVCGLAAFLPGASENGNVDARRVVVGLGNALVLWGAGVSTLV